MSTKRRNVDARCKGFNGAKNLQMKYFDAM